MALARLSMKTGKAGKAAPHAAYIAREAQYAHRLAHGERLEAKGAGNLPAWALSEPNRFWQAADRHERANGTTYREMEIALPRELTPAQRLALVRAFVRQELGARHAHQWAIHTPNAADGGEQPHVHLMFSERQTDGIDRDPDQYFRRHNPRAPEKGGAKKGYGPYSGGYLSQAERVVHLKGVRHRWETACNAALAQAGRAERIDMRSHAERGSAVPPEPKLLPSQWRQPDTRALVLDFRQARAERARAAAELNRYLPDPDATVIELADARRRREAEEVRRAEREAARTALQEGLERAAAGLVADLPARLDADALAYFRETQAQAATPAQAEQDLLKVIADSLARRLEDAGHAPPEPDDPLLRAAARRCYGPVMARVETLETTRSRQALNALEAHFRQAVARLPAEQLRALGPRADATPNPHHARLLDVIETELRDHLSAAGHPMPPQADLTDAARRCRAAVLARWTELAEREQVAREAERRRLPSLDLDALRLRRRALLEQTRPHPVPTPEQLAEHWAQVPDARRRLDAARHHLVALEAEDARWSAAHPLGSRLGHLTGLRGSERRELDRRLRDARHERQQAEAGLDTARRQAAAHLPHAAAQVRELQDADARIPRLQRELEQLDREIAAAEAARAGARSRPDAPPQTAGDAAPGTPSPPEAGAWPPPPPAADPPASNGLHAREPDPAAPAPPAPPLRPKPKYPAPGG